MLAAFKRSLQAARSFEAVQDAATQAFPRLQRARGVDRSEIAEVLTLYTGENPLSLALQTQPSRAHPDSAQHFGILQSSRSAFFPRRRAGMRGRRCWACGTICRG